MLLVRTTGFGLKAGWSSVFKAIEKWASESPDRSRLLIIAVWAVLGALVVIATGVAALILVPR